MNAAWMVVAVGVAGAIVMFVMLWYRRDHDPDLGAVSHQWIAEHRHGLGNDSRR